MKDNHGETITPGPWRNIEDIMAMNRVSGHHFFDRATMRAFGSRVSDRIYAGRFFVTSERDSGPYAAWDGYRRYTVRIAMDDGTVREPEGMEFGQYGSGAGAHKAAQRMADEVLREQEARR